MDNPRIIEIVRLAYALWQQAGEPTGRDWEFYPQAENELRKRARVESDAGVAPGLTGDTLVQRRLRYIQDRAHAFS